MMESISTTRIDILNSKIPNFKLSYLKVTKDSVPHFNSYLDQKIDRGGYPEIFLPHSVGWCVSSF